MVEYRRHLHDAPPGGIGLLVQKVVNGGRSLRTPMVGSAGYEHIVLAIILNDVVHHRPAG